MGGDQCNSLIYLRNCVRTTSVGYLNRAGLENTTWILGSEDKWDSLAPSPFMLTGPAGSYYQIFPFGHMLRSCTETEGGYSFITPRQETERNHGSTRWAKRERSVTPSNQFRRNPRKLLERKSEIAHGNIPTHGEESSLSGHWKKRLTVPPPSLTFVLS